MNFSLYVPRGRGGFEIIASTKFVEDAVRILDHWYSGYVLNSYGEIVESKRAPE